MKLKALCAKTFNKQSSQNYLQKQIPAGGPDENERAKGKTYLWGKVLDEQGNKVESRLFGMEGYTMTVLTAVKIAEKILGSDFCVGFQTPAKCYGADLILEIEGVERKDD